MQKATPKREPRKAALAFIFIMVVLDVMALGIVEVAPLVRTVFPLR